MTREKWARSLACALKQGTLSCLLHLWTEMQMVALSAETDLVSDFRRQTYHLHSTYVI